MNRQTLRRRAAERAIRLVVGDQLDQLRARLASIEAEVQECRQLNVRLAELTDLVEQLVLPAAARDEQGLAAAVEAYTRSV